MYESVGNVVMQMRHECVEVRTHARQRIGQTGKQHGAA